MAARAAVCEDGCEEVLDVSNGDGAAEVEEVAAAAAVAPVPATNEAQESAAKYSRNRSQVSQSSPT